MTDHWIVERWDPETRRWIRADPQIDDVQRRLLRIDFDPLDLPPGPFLTGGEAWRRCRAGDDDPQRFGIDDMRGQWFIAGSTIRDLAALNKIETHTWGVWGVIGDLSFRDLADDERSHVDTIARTIATADLAAIRSLYDTDDLRIEGPVVSGRTHQRVDLPLAMTPTRQAS